MNTWNPLPLKTKKETWKSCFETGNNLPNLHHCVYFFKWSVWHLSNVRFVNLAVHCLHPPLLPWDWKRPKTHRKWKQNCWKTGQKMFKNIQKWSATQAAQTAIHHILLMQLNDPIIFEHLLSAWKPASKRSNPCFFVQIFTSPKPMRIGFFKQATHWNPTS